MNPNSDLFQSYIFTVPASATVSNRVPIKSFGRLTNLMSMIVPPGGHLQRYNLESGNLMIPDLVCLR